MKIFISLLALFTLFAGWMVYQAASKTSSEILSVSQLLETNKDRARVRLGARVSEDPIEYTLEPKISLKFKVIDRDSSNKNNSIQVVYDELKPDMFSSGRDVLIDGEYKNGVLIAHSLLTQCPSKYEAPTPDQKVYK